MRRHPIALKMSMKSVLMGRSPVLIQCADEYVLWLDVPIPAAGSTKRLKAPR